MSLCQVLTEGPALYNVGNDQALIWWETDVITDAINYIQYWPTGSPLQTTDVTATTVTVRDTFDGTSYIHYSLLTGLSAGTSYTFTVNGEQLTTPEYSFSTYASDGSTVTLGLWGCNHGNVSASVPGFAATLSAMASYGVDGYLGTGGYVSNGELHRYWVNHWYDVIGSYLQSKSFTGCRGEADGSFYMSKSMMPFFHESGSYQFVKIGKAVVVVLDSNRGVPRTSLKQGGEQLDWFLNSAVTDTVWKDSYYRVVLVHHPFRTTYWNNSGVYGDGNTIQSLYDDLFPVLKSAGTDLVIQGHSRSYQRGSYQSTYPESEHCVYHIVSGGGGDYAHTNREWDWQPPNDPGIVFDSFAYHFLALEISSTSLKVRCIKTSDSSVLDTVTLTPHSLP